MKAPEKATLSVRHPDLIFPEDIYGISSNNISIYSRNSISFALSAKHTVPPIAI